MEGVDGDGLRGLVEWFERFEKFEKFSATRGRARKFTSLPPSLSTHMLLKLRRASLLVHLKFLLFFSLGGGPGTHPRKCVPVACAHKFTSPFFLRILISSLFQPLLEEI